jgi:hypothetical protein
MNISADNVCGNTIVCGRSALFRNIDTPLIQRKIRGFKDLANEDYKLTKCVKGI